MMNLIYSTLYKYTNIQYTQIPDEIHSVQDTCYTSPLDLMITLKLYKYHGMGYKYIQNNVIY